MSQRPILRHFVATLAYRGKNVLQNMPPAAATLRPHPTVRTPVEILNHINGVLSYAHSFFVEYDSIRPKLADWEIEVARFFEVLTRLNDSLSAGDSLREVREMQLLQGPFADAMLHLGQIGIFRRMAGSPVESENYIFAEIGIGTAASHDPVGQMLEARLVDVSHTIEDGLITYKGLPAPVICDFLSREESRKHYAEDTEFHIGKIEMVANTGTYLDSPFHRYANGKDLSELPLSSLADLPTVVVRAGGRQIDASAFVGLDVSGKAVLVDTGWSQHWKTDAYFEGHPFLTEDAAIFLRDHGATLVGIDSLNIDDTNDGRRPVHSTLLAADIPIVEHLKNLAALPRTGSRFFAVPVKVRAFGTFPVRAFAKVGD